MSEHDLAQLGLRPRETVRFRRRATERWATARTLGVEADGSIRVADGRGAVLSLPISSIEVSLSGPRGASRWEPLAERAARIEQLPLL
ncbi:MAG TPA: hypothetical protein VNB24_03830 [Acidimicrobiales bacterium]|nr:hypothetical protein [Acidimicrobiales bacterium]